jgi:hypothetical protein
MRADHHISRQIEDVGGNMEILVGNPRHS